MKVIKVSLRLNEFTDDKDDDENVDSFGILAAGLDVQHNSPVLQFDGWLESYFAVVDSRFTAVLDCINGLTLFEAEEIQ